MRRLALFVTTVVLILVFLMSSYAHDFSSNSFWQEATQWYPINTSSSNTIESAKFRYIYLDYNNDTDTCIGLNILINDKNKITQTTLSCTGFKVNFYNNSGESLDSFHVLAKEGSKQEKGANGTFATTCEAFNASKGSNYRFYAEYHSLSKFAQSNNIITKIQLFDSESLAVFSSGNELTFNVPRLSIEPTTTQKTSKTNKSKKSANKSGSSKTGSSKKKKYYSSTTSAKNSTKYSSKSKGGYYSSVKNNRSKVSTTKANSNTEETENYNKADIVDLQENNSAMNNKQVIAISVISALAGCLIAIIVLLIIKKKKHNSSIDDNKQ